MEEVEIGREKEDRERKESKKKRKIEMKCVI